MVNRPEGEEIDGEWVIDDQGEAERDAAARQEIEQKRQEALDQAAQRVQQAVEAAISRDDEDERRALAKKRG
jgi:hypothetical protein